MNIVTMAGQHFGLWQNTIMDAAVQRLRTDRGEGVISMAIAVLIVAFLGVAMWLVFKGFSKDTEKILDEQVKKIGS